MTPAQMAVPERPRRRKRDRIAVDPGSDVDTGLMLRAKNDDLESFSILLERNQKVVLAYLSRMVRNRAIAEELTQDVFIRVYRSRAAYCATAKFSTWLYRIATNVALNYFRNERGYMRNTGLETREGVRVRLEVVDRALSIEDHLVREVAAGCVRRAVEALPARQRTVVIMHKYQDMCHDRVARELGCTTLAVKSLLFRAYANLRVRLRGLILAPCTTATFLSNGRS